MNLLEEFRRYPGGVTALARGVGVSRQSIYNFAGGRTVGLPVLIADRIAEMLANQRCLLGRPITLSRIVAAWRAVRTQQLLFT